MIRYLRHCEIDKFQWDDCISNSSNGLVYALSWYLDIVAKGWEALVEDDYKAVMPLPSKRKYGLCYLIQPRFTQQLGVFSPRDLTAAKVISFLRHIPKKFVWCNIYLNQANYDETLTYIPVRVNYELDIHPAYSSFVKGYHENTRRNLKRAVSANVVICFCEDAGRFVELYQKHSKVRNTDIAIEQLSQLIDKSIDNRSGKIVLAMNTDGEVLSAAFYLVGLNRIIYIASFTTEKGHEISAMFLMMDKVIEKYSSQLKIFDFEGSMIPGIARFFKGFGASKKVYPQFAYKFRNGRI